MPRPQQGMNSKTHVPNQVPNQMHMHASQGFRYQAHGSIGNLHTGLQIQPPRPFVNNPHTPHTPNNPMSNPNPPNLMMEMSLGHTAGHMGAPRPEGRNVGYDRHNEYFTQPKYEPQQQYDGKFEPKYDGPLEMDMDMMLACDSTDSRSRSRTRSADYSLPMQANDADTANNTHSNSGANWGYGL
eukprot:CAMPEP_0173262172 /NCGR_PEP_ID=MMETSP1142-20121109/26625_1 /TAXON_ID=483371 /ORGANISM="non described non described, Strain CCMP2298" /LENGTH=183 /DNA_ID=CAMNT_0014197277 /DNA_START=8 /DNA_END=556 /DNA_ORIENTATION=-